MPKTRVNFWSDKFTANRARDATNVAMLRAIGWRVLTVWECALRGKTAFASEKLAAIAESWLNSASGEAELSGLSTSDWA